ncbi:MAG TPA: heavy metal-binding domain-containing protein [Syntrophales bacterium]|nr:heavy metal-binding domain-containing protein [Syntrophales bacterium]
MDVLLVAAVLFVAFIVFSLFGRSNKTAELDAEIKNLRERIIVVTSNSLPDGGIKGALGNVTGISETAASTDRGFRKAEKEALADIMRQGIQMGANALVDLKMTTGSYEQQGSQWMVSKVVYYGTAVKV